ncbi:uncharacterized protein LOC124776053 [Schistocerca piceifrons]|uniref:uncharacterized protein LOC124776053 n=1 Tax=Schistocerca piceifrons TaxID=274613 RepID=UPI001F5F1392|nr:uncharacterized protein LOC124776053 [Schistocerca piceifrons]
MSQQWQKWSTTDHELFTIHLAIKNFSPLVEGRHFAVYIDYKPLVAVFQCDTNLSSSHQCRQVKYIARFSSDVQHIAGKDNVVADSLSWNCASLNSIHWAKIVLKQQNCIAAQICASHGCAGQYLCYNLAHLGVQVTAKLVSTEVVWMEVQKDCHAWACMCLTCQHNKISSHVFTPVAYFLMSSARFLHTHLDNVWLLPYSVHQLYLLMIIDHFTMWPEVIGI